MLKYVLLVALIVAAVSARPQEIQVVKQTDNNNGSGTFQALIELSDGSKVEQTGSIKNPEEPDPQKHIQVLKGSFQFSAPNGDVYETVYTADENGFRPTTKLLRSGRR